MTKIEPDANWVMQIREKKQFLSSTTIFVCDILEKEESWQKQPSIFTQPCEFIFPSSQERTVRAVQFWRVHPRDPERPKDFSPKDYASFVVPETQDAKAFEELLVFGVQVRPVGPVSPLETPSSSLDSFERFRSALLDD